MARGILKPITERNRDTEINNEIDDGIRAQRIHAVLETPVLHD